MKVVLLLSPSHQSPPPAERLVVLSVHPSGFSRQLEPLWRNIDGIDTLHAELSIFLGGPVWKLCVHQALNRSLTCDCRSVHCAMEIKFVHSPHHRDWKGGDNSIPAHTGMLTHVPLVM